MISRHLVVVVAIGAVAWMPDALSATPEAPSDQNSSADSSLPPPVSVKPAVEKIDDSRYRIGDLIFDQKTREIRFPTKVNMSQGLLEYLVVLSKGKVHEALLVTEISPTHLNLAFKLLRYPASRELFSISDENGRPTGKYPHVSADTKAGARIVIDVEWMDDGKTRRIPVNEWIQHIVSQRAMKPGPWLYSGSDFNEGKFIAEMTGDHASIMVDSGAIINYAGSDNGDNVWFGFPKRVPPEGTPVTVIIAPFSKIPTSQQP